MCLQAYADSEGPNQPTHLRSLIRPSLSANRIIGSYRIFNGEQNPRGNFARKQGDLNLHILRMFKGTFFIT